jgi:hypothetical protein
MTCIVDCAPDPIFERRHNDGAVLPRAVPRAASAYLVLILTAGHRTNTRLSCANAAATCVVSSPNICDGDTSLGERACGDPSRDGRIPGRVPVLFRARRLA